MARSSISQKNIKLLWGRSGNKCAICKSLLSVEDENNTILGEMAHIKGENKTSARWDSSLSENEKNDYDNLILLCSPCHKIIDGNESKYSKETLKEIKRSHENLIKSTLMQNILSVNFSELDKICKGLAGQIDISNNIVNFDRIKQRDKAIRNNFSEDVQSLIKVGLTQSNRVSTYLNKQPDLKFGDRLKSEFIRKYTELMKNGSSGDQLFYEMVEFASLNKEGFRAVSITLNSYFFELCEVYKK